MYGAKYDGVARAVLRRPLPLAGVFVSPALPEGVDVRLLVAQVEVEHVVVGRGLVVGDGLHRLPLVHVLAQLVLPVAQHVDLALDGRQNDENMGTLGSHGSKRSSRRYTANCKETCVHPIINENDWSRGIDY